MKAASSRGMLFVAAVYLSVGLLIAELARASASHQMVIVWRWTAWVVSGCAFARARRDSGPIFHH